MRRVVLVLAALAALAGCSTTNTNKGGYITQDGTISIVKVGHRAAAPEIAGTDLEGKPLDIKDYAGKTLVINIWASWCAPCRLEAPALSAAAKQFADKDVQFIGLNVRDQTSSALAFERRNGITYPSIADQSGKLQLGFAKTLPTLAYPTTYIIDSDGKVAVRALDKLTKPTLVGLIQDVQKSTA